MLLWFSAQALTRQLARERIKLGMMKVSGSWPGTGGIRPLIRKTVGKRERERGGERDRNMKGRKVWGRRGYMVEWRVRQGLLKVGQEVGRIPCSHCVWLDHSHKTGFMSALILGAIPSLVQDLLIPHQQVLALNRPKTCLRCHQQVLAFSWSKTCLRRHQELSALNRPRPAYDVTNKCQPSASPGLSQTSSKTVYFNWLMPVSDAINKCQLELAQTCRGRHQ